MVNQYLIKHDTNWSLNLMNRMSYFFMVITLLLPMTTHAANQLSKPDYQLLNKAANFIESEQYSVAYQYLVKIKDTVSSDYARALVAHNLGQVELQRENYGKALGHLNDAYQRDVLSKKQQSNLLRTIAQLSCLEVKWQTCIDHLNLWMKEEPTKIKGSDNFLLAQAYSQLENWQAVNAPVQAAINSIEVAPQSWYQLNIVAHIQLKQWQAAIGQQKVMISHYGDNPEFWRQLVFLHIQVKDNKAALADQRIGFENKLLREENDYLLLAQMLLQAEIPFYAGEVIQQGLDRGEVLRNKKNLTVLSHSWIQAGENQRAVQVLTKINQLDFSPKILIQIAQIQIQLQYWSAAKETLLTAIENSQGEQARLQLLLAIVHIKLKNYPESRQSLAIAANDQQIKGNVDSWMTYLEQVSL